MNTEVLSNLLEVARILSADFAEARGQAPDGRRPARAQSHPRPDAQREEPVAAVVARLRLQLGPRWRRPERRAASAAQQRARSCSRSTRPTSRPSGSRQAESPKATSTWWRPCGRATRNAHARSCSQYRPADTNDLRGVRRKKSRPRRVRFENQRRLDRHQEPRGSAQKSTSNRRTTMATAQEKMTEAASKIAARGQAPAIGASTGSSSPVMAGSLGHEPQATRA